jgi:hypothetical protein
MKCISFALLGSLLMMALVPSCDAPSPQPAELAVRQFIERYFSTWSAQDMEGYAACFHGGARITYLSDRGEARTDSLSDFLYGQRMGHKTSPEPMKEVANSMDIQMDDRAALARVRWTLTKGEQETTGTDHFSLINTPAGWKIIHLTFYAD